MYRIYIDDTALIISESLPGGLGSHQQISEAEFDFMKFYRLVKGTPGSVNVLLTKEPKLFFKKIRKLFMVIKAAGGVVRNDENQFLFIFRKGKWDLPKGKLDEGEKTKKAAVREVEEECGIKVSKLGDLLCKTWHVYEEKGQVVFKKTTWFNMKAKRQELVPQLEEGITEARWLASGDFNYIKENTYPLIRDVISLLEV
ncbi:MAG: NUDIX domain-containing protein [Sphingobacteriaceae bacterium]|nr:NUDIX domain-containing protein [Sphingobacteriaceae bacterium]